MAAKETFRRGYRRALRAAGSRPSRIWRVLYAAQAWLISHRLVSFSLFSASVLLAGRSVALAIEDIQITGSARGSLACLTGAYVCLFAYRPINLSVAALGIVQRTLRVARAHSWLDIRDRLTDSLSKTAALQLAGLSILATTLGQLPESISFSYLPNPREQIGFWEMFKGLEWETATISLSLPFSWRYLYIAALSVSIARAAFVLGCPKHVKRFTSPGEFESSRLPLHELTEHNPNKRPSPRFLSEYPNYITACWFDYIDHHDQKSQALRIIAGITYVAGAIIYLILAAQAVYNVAWFMIIRG